MSSFFFLSECFHIYFVEQLCPQNIALPLLTSLLSASNSHPHSLHVLVTFIFFYYKYRQNKRLAQTHYLSSLYGSWTRPKRSTIFRTTDILTGQNWCNRQESNLQKDDWKSPAFTVQPLLRLKGLHDSNTPHQALAGLRGRWSLDYHTFVNKLAPVSGFEPLSVPLNRRTPSPRRLDGN